MPDDIIKYLDKIKSGPGRLHLGPVNTLVTNYANPTNMKCVGSISKDGFDLENQAEDFSHETGSPLSNHKEELQKRGVILKMKLKEIYGDTLYYACQEGSSSTVVADATAAFTRTFTCYGYNKTNLSHLHDIASVISISDDSPTPVTWADPATIGANWTIDKPNAMIAPTISGDVVTDNNGATFTIVGTWAKPLEHILTIPAEGGSEKPFYTAFYEFETENRRRTGIWIYKGYFEKPESIPFKVGQERLIGISFRSCQDPTQMNHCLFIDEMPAS